MKLDPQLLSLSLVSEAVSDLAYQAARGSLDCPDRLHQEMRLYQQIVAGYLGLPSMADVIRAHSERYDDQYVKSAFERLAQLAETDNLESFGFPPTPQSTRIQQVWPSS